MPRVNGRSPENAQAREVRSRPVAATAWERRGARRSARPRPHLDEVVALVTPGVTVPLRLTEIQRRAIRADRKLARAVKTYQHQEAARARLPEAQRRDHAPFTPEGADRISRRAGLEGMCRGDWQRSIRRMAALGIIGPVPIEDERGKPDTAHYHRRASGHRVTLWRCLILWLRKSGAGVKRTGDERGSVKPRPRPRWWAHPLFGCPDGRPPPGMTRRQRRMWRSADERMGTRQAAAWA